MNRIKETAERIKQYINEHIFKLVTIKQLSIDIRITIKRIQFYFKCYYGIYPKDYIQWGLKTDPPPAEKITLFAALCRAGGKADKNTVKEYTADLGYLSAYSLCMLIQRKVKMDMCAFCEAVFDDDFYYKLLDNPFTRINVSPFVASNVGAFVASLLSKYHIDKAK
jgi:AraC-like DNA-binding protein